MEGRVTHYICKLNLTYLTFFFFFFLSGPLPDPHIMASGEKLRDKHPQPGVCTLLHGLEGLNLVDSKFGPVPFGSVLSYQCPPEMSRDIIKHPGAPEFPPLPVEGYHFKFHYNFEATYKQQCHLESLKVSREISAAIEAETRMPAVDPGTQTPTDSQQIW